MAGLIENMSLLTMGYFDDLRFIRGAVLPGCTAVVDARFPGTYSVELMTAGRMAYGVDQGAQAVLDSPMAFWHHPNHTIMCLFTKSHKHSNASRQTGSR